MEKCVYLVEDDPDIAYIIQYFLEEEEMKVNIFYTVKSLQITIEETSPDFFIFDFNLPDGNGLELCNDVKADPRWAKIPILILSAHKTTDELAENCTAEAYLSKPFDLDNLLKTVNGLLKE
ncbi:response regulator transcription factor [Pedobacter sp. PAMC26386]|nr:response regulator transcription factor [Pedobacter sp. PAMC26386]